MENTNYHHPLWLNQQKKHNPPLTNTIEPQIYTPNPALLQATRTADWDSRTGQGAPSRRDAKANSVGTSGGGKGHL
jgi:hypothetical protein